MHAPCHTFKSRSRKQSSPHLKRRTSCHDVLFMQQRSAFHLTNLQSVWTVGTFAGLQNPFSVPMPRTRRIFRFMFGSSRHSSCRPHMLQQEPHACLLMDAYIAALALDHCVLSAPFHVTEYATPCVCSCAAGCTEAIPFHGQPIPLLMPCRQSPHPSPQPTHKCALRSFVRSFILPASPPSQHRASHHTACIRPALHNSISHPHPPSLPSPRGSTRHCCRTNQSSILLCNRLLPARWLL